MNAPQMTVNLLNALSHALESIHLCKTDDMDQVQQVIDSELKIIAAIGSLAMQFVSQDMLNNPAARC